MARDCLGTMKQIKTLSPRHSSLHIVWHAKGVVLKQGFMGMGGQTVDQPYPAILSATKPKKQNKHPKQRYPATLEADAAKQTRQTAIPAVPLVSAAIPSNAGGQPNPITLPGWLDPSRGTSPQRKWAALSPQISTPVSV